jgi:hypothetical protein
MTKLTPIEGGPLVSLDDLPQRCAEERLEDLARELMTVTAMLDSAELHGSLCQAETVERAKRALQAGAAARATMRTACEPATVREVCEHIAVLIQSIPQGEPTDGYSAALTTDVGRLQPNRGALEAACRRLRTTAMFRPRIPEVLAAVREAGIMYETALRAIDELPGQIARAAQSEDVEATDSERE